MNVCATCRQPFEEVGPEGGRCRAGHWTPRSEFSVNGKAAGQGFHEKNGHLGHLGSVDDFATISAADLIRKQFSDPKWAIPEILPEGLNLMAGPPKKGKSWLMLGIGAAIALGGTALGKVAVTAGDVLYLALEDTERRLQERLLQLLDGEAAPSRLHLVTRWPRIGDGGTERIANWLQAHPNARLVMIDTLAMLRPLIEPGRSLYAIDYALGEAMKTIADKHHVTFMVSTHTRKAESADPLDTINATQGLAGSADTILILKREMGRADASLYVRGRDVQERDHALGFEQVTCQWSLLGDAAEYRLSEGRAEVVKLLQQAAAPMSPKQIADALGGDRGNIRVLLHRMAATGQVLNQSGRYHVPCLLPPVTPVTGETPGVDPITGVTPVTGTHPLASPAQVTS